MYYHKADWCLPAIFNYSALAVAAQPPTDTHAPRISQHSQIKTSCNGSRNTVYLCFRVVRLLSSFCLLLWILLKKSRGDRHTVMCYMMQKQRKGNIYRWTFCGVKQNASLPSFPFALFTVTLLLTNNFLVYVTLSRPEWPSVECLTCKCNDPLQDCMYEDCEV